MIGLVGVAGLQKRQYGTSRITDTRWQHISQPYYAQTQRANATKWQ